MRTFAVLLLHIGIFFSSVNNPHISSPLIAKLHSTLTLAVLIFPPPAPLAFFSSVTAFFGVETGALVSPGGAGEYPPVEGVAAPLPLAGELSSGAEAENPP